MFFNKAFSIKIKRALSVMLLLATALNLCGCIDFDAYFESLLEGEGQGSSIGNRPEKEESEDKQEQSVELPETAAELFTVTNYSGASGMAGLAVVSYNGNESFVKIPSHIQGTPVVAVYKNAFSDRAESDGVSAFAVTEVIVPSTVEFIEYGAFYNCKKLKSIELPFIGGTDGGNNFGHIFGDGGEPKSLENVRAGGMTIADNAFISCVNLVSIELTAAENIGNNAFKNCIALKTLILPSTVSAMGADVFAGCKSLETLAVPYLNSDAGLFAGSIFGGTGYGDNMAVMPESLRNLTVYWNGDIPNNAFYECDKLVNLSFKGNVGAVGEYAFYRCRRLKTLSFEGDEGFEGVSSIGKNAFAYCSSLGAVALSENIRRIPDFCFYSCASLRSIKFGEKENTMPDGVSSIGTGAFAYCENLVSLKLSPTITVLPDSVFEGCAYLSSLVVFGAVQSIGNKAFSGCTNLNTVEFEEGATIQSIGDSAFAYCSSLKEISLPDSITTLGSYVFSHCWSLKTAKLTNGISLIPDGCFFGCTRLTKAEFDRNTVTVIGERAFSGCEYIKEINLSDAIEEIGKYAFDECKNLVFTVNTGSYAYTWLLNNGVGSNNLKLN
ncbi:MAG: leucine-rich repeat domain-containing protein [Clostridia bacterium]|nr:leucine-rich repeat domain-containing protein [Clostridia bacterium]